MKHVICKDCGWIHFSQTEKEVKEHAQKVKEFIDSLEESRRKEVIYQNFSVEESVEKQKKCFRCDSNQLRLATDSERPPILSTIQSIIFKD